MILAGVTIVTLIGDNGLLTKAEQAKNTSEKASEKEKIQVEVMGAYDKRGRLLADKVVENIDNNINDVTSVEATLDSFPVKVTFNNGNKYQVSDDGNIMGSVDAGETAPIDSNAVYASGDYTAVIPAGFTVSGTKGETSIENGLVVRDINQNEWVWIPVSSSDLAAMYIENSTGWTISGTSGNNKVITNFISTGNGRGVPGSTGKVFREPDMLISGNYDMNLNNLSSAGFSDYTDMATCLKNDYKEMINSLKKYGGFYVGRYELGKNTNDIPQVKRGNVFNNTDWYHLYKACKFFSSNEVKSRMIWGCQWDQICKYISKYKDNDGKIIQRNLNDSSSYGNYKNSTVSTEICGFDNFNQTTGRSEKWKTNNIYDLAGNCWEWNQEACYTESRGSNGRRL